MSDQFDNLIQVAKAKLEELRACQPVEMSDIPQLPEYAGVYLISQGSDEYLYAGIAGNVRRRLRQHMNGRQNQSAFTQKLALFKFKKQNPTVVGSIQQLKTLPDFRLLFAGCATEISGFNVRFVKAESLALRIVLEVYVGLTFATKWNDFNIKAQP